MRDMHKAKTTCQVILCRITPQANRSDFEMLSSLLWQRTSPVKINFQRFLFKQNRCFPPAAYGTFRRAALLAKRSLITVIFSRSSRTL